MPKLNKDYVDLKILSNIEILSRSSSYLVKLLYINCNQIFLIAIY